MSTQPSQPLPRLLLRLWHHIPSRRRMHLGVLFLLMILVSFAEVISIGAVLPFLSVLSNPEPLFEHHHVQPLIEVLELTEPRQLLLPFTIVFIAAAIFSGTMRLLLLLVQTRLSQFIGSDLSIDIYRRTLYQPYAVHVARNSSEVIAGIWSKANSVGGSTIMPILTIISSSLMLFTIPAALIAIEPLVATTALVGFASIYGVIIHFTKNRLERDSQRVNREYTQAFKALQEGLGGIRDVLIDGTQATYCDIYRKADLPLRRAIANTQIIAGIPRYSIEALGMVLIALLAYSLAVGPEGITGAIPVLGALTLGAQRLLPVFQQGYANWSTMRAGKAPLSDALELLEQPLPEYVEAPLPEPISFEDSITLSNLTFQYSSRGPRVLDGLCLTIPKCSRIGFIGTTGSGKSTLLDIVMGLLTPTEGTLAIDGEVITEGNHRAWQMHIAHVPQSIFLADITVAENIALGLPREQIDYDRMRRAAQKAQIAETIESWDKQYSTLVGENGIRLSGGQRQRIGIARALYKKADVLVFDEATSALDNDTELAVMQAIESLSDELTILIVAHRLTTLKSCTQIVDLGDGKIKRLGKYRDIIHQHS